MSGCRHWSLATLGKQVQVASVDAKSFPDLPIQPAAKKLILAMDTTPRDRMRFEMGTLFCFSAAW